MHSFFT